MDETIGPFKILGEIAAGGMGVVYRARAPEGDEVAIKVLLRVEHHPRFDEEVRVAQRLRHPAIVTVRGAGRTHDGLPYLVMDLLPGGSFAQRLKRDGPLDEDEVVAVGLRLCDALSYAHAQGVIHRDLKPANVLVDGEGQAKLADFGLGKRLDVDTRITATGEILGTPGYMAPEQATAERDSIGPATDVYGVGATLYALLTGRPPFKAPTLINVLHALVHAAPPPPSRFRPGVSPDLERVLLRCLEKEPAQRFPSSYDLGQTLRTLRPMSTPPAVRRARGGLLTALAMIGVGTLVAAGVILARSRDPASPPSTESPSDLPPPPAEPTVGEQALERLGVIRDEQSAGRLQQTALREALAEVDRSLAVALREDPVDPESLLALGWSQALGGRPGQALVPLRKAARLAPQVALAHLLLASAHHLALVTGQGGDPQEAHAALDRALELEPESAVAHEIRGQLLARSDPVGALAEFGRALELDPRRTFTWRARAYGRFEAADFHGALADLTRAIELTPDEPAAYLLRAQAHARLGEEALALLDLDAARRTDANASALALTQATVLLELRRLDAAETVLKELLSREPDRSKGWTVLARVMLTRMLERGPSPPPRSVPEAINETVHRALNARPGDLEARVTQARLLQITGDLEQAAQVVARILQLKPGWAPALAVQGDVLLHNGKHEQALSAYRAALEADPLDRQALLGHAEARYRLGQEEAARLEFDALLARHPHPRAFMLRATLRANQGDLAGALEDANRALKLCPHAISYRFRSDVALQLGDHELASADADHAVTLMRTAQAPGLPEVLSHRAQLKHTLGRLEEARADIREAAALRPDDIELLEMLIGVSRQLGDLERAEADATHALDRPRPPSQVVRLQLVRAEIRLQRGDAEGARSDLHALPAPLPAPLQRRAEAVLKSLGG